MPEAPTQVKYCSAQTLNLGPRGKVSSYVPPASGGARVFAARANIYVAAPANQISSAIKVFFRILGHGGVIEPPLGPRLFPPLSFAPLSVRGVRVYPYPRSSISDPTSTRGYGSGTGRCLTGRVGYEVHGYGYTRFYP